MINNNVALQPWEVLNVVIDPGAYTHMKPHEKLIQEYNKHEANNLYPFSDQFSQLYFENPKNKCILIRGCEDEYENDHGTIKLKTKNKFPGQKDLHRKYKYDEIHKIIIEQAGVLGINLKNIKKINIFDISHTNPNTKRFSTGFIDEKVNALKALNELCPNCKHTKIASTACWGGRQDDIGRDLIEEVKTSIEGNINWRKNNIVEIDITPENEQNTSIVVGRDGKPHVSYCLDTYIYTEKHQQLPATFKRHIHLLAKGKQNVVVQQTHTFQNNQYRVAEGEGGFQELSTQYVKEKMQPENIQTTMFSIK